MCLVSGDVCGYTSLAAMVDVDVVIRRLSGVCVFASICRVRGFYVEVCGGGLSQCVWLWVFMLYLLLACDYLSCDSWWWFILGRECRCVYFCTCWLVSMIFFLWRVALWMFRGSLHRGSARRCRAGQLRRHDRFPLKAESCVLPPCLGMVMEHRLLANKAASSPLCVGCTRKQVVHTKQGRLMPFESTFRRLPSCYQDW